MNLIICRAMQEPNRIPKIPRSLSWVIEALALAALIWAAS